MKKTTLKRILSVMLAMLMILTLVLSATACGSKKDDKKDDDEKKSGSKKPSVSTEERNEFIDSIGGVSETFVGAVSEESYYSSENAAEAFVKEEIVGEDSATILDMNNKGELTDEQLAKANIPDELLYDADSVEAIEVTYETYSSDMYSGNNIDTLASSNSKKVTVYVIKYGPDWKYFVPMPETNKTITRTYYDSVFDNAKYQNCTLQVTMEMDATIKAAGESMTMKMTMTQTVKHAYGRVYFEQTTTSSGMGENSTDTICAYIEEDEYGYITCYIKDTDGSWYEASIYNIGFSSIEELTPFYGSYLDYTYFTKTNYGFELAGENAKRYFEQALMGGLGSMGSMIDTENMDLGMYAEYYVNNGVLSGVMVEAAVDMTMSQGGETAELKETVVTNTTCTNYGSTVVERPNVD